MAFVPDKFIIIGIILIILYLAYRVLNQGAEERSDTEGFESLIDRAIDRMNPLASSQNALTNKIIPVGISEGGAALQRVMNQVALNIPTPAANSQGTISQSAPPDKVSPRIDNENSFLGMVKFCKDNGGGTDPFANAKFAESCGVCLSSGTLIDGTTFSNQTGMLVYNKDKEKFDKERRENNYPFTRAIPSATAGTCVGASKGNDALPVFAINQKEFRSFRKRATCITSSAFGDDCGVCLNNNKWSWVDTDGNYIATILYLWGLGTAGVKIGGVSIGGDQTLGMNTAAKYNLGTVEEGASVELNIAHDDGPFVYGAIYSQTPSEGVYRLAVDRFMERDASTGSFPRAGGTQTFTAQGVSVSCVQLKAQKTKKVLKIQGQFPLTFADSDQLSSFDCPNAPYVLSAENMGLFSTTDPCLNPPGQSAGNYTDQCLQATLSAGGCSTNGGWYSDLSVLRADFPNATLSAIRGALAGGSTTDTNYMSKCKGVDISTPCDAFINGGTPNVACLTFLYTNASATTPIGAAYNANPSSATTTSASSTATPLFCRAAGTLNPQNAGGAGELIGAAQGYDGLTGIEAVKAYLTAVFTKAVGNLDLNKPDSQGGRRTSWDKCIGLPVAAVEAATIASPSSASSAASAQVADVPGPTTGCAAGYSPGSPGDGYVPGAMFPINASSSFIYEIERANTPWYRVSYADSSMQSGSGFTCRKG
jgi:hypothetical protein